MPETLQHKATIPQTKNVVKNNLKIIRQKHNFYKLKYNSSVFSGLFIIKARVAEKLKEMNYFRFDIDTETIRFVHIENNMIEEVSKEQIIDEFFKWLDKLEPYEHEIYVNEIKIEDRLITSKMIKETLFEKLSEYFSKFILNRLTPGKPIKIKNDTKTEKYFYFKNGFLTVNKNGYTLSPLKDLDSLIWKNNVLPREFAQDNSKGDFEKFLENTCSNDKTRKKSLMTILGYNMHCFFSRKLFITILTDSSLEADLNNGRTGKGLLIESLGHMVNSNENSKSYIEIDGKKIKDKGKHVYENASLETFIIHIDDLYRNAGLDPFYVSVLKGIEVDQKNKAPFNIKCKLVITSNKTPKIYGESDIDRVKIFELSDYYNATRSPISEFKKWFFSQDWGQGDWNSFTTFMLKCCVEFFKNDIFEARPINLHQRFLIDHTHERFVYFMDDFIQTGKTNYIDRADHRDIEYDVNLEFGGKMLKKDLYLSFEYNTKSYFTRFPNQNTFTKWLKFYTKYNANLKEMNSRSGLEFRRGGKDFIIFEKEEKKDENQ